MSIFWCLVTASVHYLQLTLYMNAIQKLFSGCKNVLQNPHEGWILVMDLPSFMQN